MCRYFFESMIFFFTFMDEFFAPVSNLALIFKFPGNMLTISTQPTVCLSTAKARWDGLATHKTLNSVIAKNLFFISFTHSAWNRTIVNKRDQRRRDRSPSIDRLD
jgi:hypothetical protein